jgi:hypothetical protein
MRCRTLFGTGNCRGDRQCGVTADEGSGLSGPVVMAAPGHIGMVDIAEVESTTQVMRALDYQFGGGGVSRCSPPSSFGFSVCRGASGTDRVRPVSWLAGPQVWGAAKNGGNSFEPDGRWFSTGVADELKERVGAMSGQTNLGVGNQEPDPATAENPPRDIRAGDHAREPEDSAAHRSDRLDAGISPEKNIDPQSPAMPAGDRGG